MVFSQSKEKSQASYWQQSVREQWFQCVGMGLIAMMVFGWVQGQSHRDFRLSTGSDPSTASALAWQFQALWD